MKSLLAYVTLVSTLLFSVSCGDDKIVEFNPVNHLKQFSQVALQSKTFELDSIYMVFKGKDGTTIYFARDQFEIEENQKITVALKEFYSFKELIYNNINTVTNKGELLKSSGVIYLDFLTNGKSLKLKEGERIEVQFPENRLRNNNIYYGKIDSINQFKWTEEDSLFTTILQYDRTYAIELAKVIPMDSLPYYRRLDSLLTEQLESYAASDRIVINRFKWINIDKVIAPDYLMNFDLSVQNTKLDNFSFYITYEDQNSFISEYRTKEYLDFKKIPIKGKTQLIAVAKKGGNFFAKKVELDSSQKKLGIMLKEMDTIQLKSLMVK